MDRKAGWNCQGTCIEVRGPIDATSSDIHITRPHAVVAVAGCSTIRIGGTSFVQSPKPDRRIGEHRLLVQRWRLRRKDPTHGSDHEHHHGKKYAGGSTAAQAFASKRRPKQCLKRPRIWRSQARLLRQ